MPLAVIQIVVGVLLGPSVLGRLAPEVTAVLLNPAALAPLSGIATLAVTLFAFVTGLHTDAGLLRRRGAAVAWVGVGSALLPALLGAGAGLLLADLDPQLLGPRASPLLFAAAVGICTSVTALPVLGAILLQLGLLARPLGQLALICAAINDGLLWLLLAILLAVAGTGDAAFWPQLLGLPCYVVVMLSVVRPLLARTLGPMRDGAADALHEAGLVAVTVVALGSAAATEALGVHHVLGAFLAGTVVPRWTRHAILARLEAAVATVLMPFFFILVGLRTLVDLGSSTFVAVFLVATLAASVGKLGGTAILARLAGETWRSALGLGALLQTKGLMEVVVLTILLDAGLIGPAVFSALVLMALATTAATMPLTRLLAGEAVRPAAAVTPVTPTPAPADLWSKRQGT